LAFSFKNRFIKEFAATDIYEEIESVVYTPQISRPDVAKLRPAKDFCASCIAEL
jgi:hypothetical protein